MSKKKEVLARLFDICQNRDNFIFDNNEVKQVALKVGFGNPFDATKIDNSELLPENMKQANYFVVHLGEGRHQFVENIASAYHQFETIAENDVMDWKYKKSLLNEFDSSESNILSLAFNQRIMHKFLYDDVNASAKIYNARRTKTSLNYQVNGQLIQTKNMQIEIDMTMELNGMVTIFEGKNNFPENFSIYQIFMPFLYYQTLKKAHRLAIETTNCCYLLRKRSEAGSIIRVYLYSFTSDDDMSSIKLLKSRQYNLRAS